MSQHDLTPAVITHTFIRLRGQQDGVVTVHNARTDTARVTLAWSGCGIHMSFLNARAAQGALEGFATARKALINLPANVAPASPEPYDQPAIAIDWTTRPQHATEPRHKTVDGPRGRRVVRWVEIYMGPVTFQILDRTAYHSTTNLLADVHRIAVAVCLDAPHYAADPTGDDYRPTARD